ncbi:MAG: hypothetical protein M3N98_14690, partial [Actinomycetota bacterium]|nr:hypothetical protein [Actinomycetota bacterium]
MRDLSVPDLRRPLRLGRWCCGAAAVLALLGASWARPGARASADAPLPLTPLGGTTFTLPPFDRAQIRMAVTVSDAVTIGTVAVLGVSADTIQRVDLDAAVTPSFDPASESIVLEIPNASVLDRPATYHVMLLITATAKPPPATPAPATKQRLVVDLVRMAGQVEAPSTLAVSLQGADQILPAFVVRTDAQTRLTGLTVERAEPNGRGSIAFDTVPVPIGPDTSRVITYQATGFPLGTTKQTYTVRSPQLTTPVPVVFEVTKKRPVLWLVGAMVLGILGGLLVRVVLAWLITLSRARETWAEMAIALQDAAGAHPDRAFQAALQPLIDELSTVNRTQWRQAAAITAAVNDVKPKLDTALSDLKKATAEATAELQPLEDIVDRNWQVPTSLAQAFADLRTGVQTAVADLDRGDPTTAKEGFVKATTVNAVVLQAGASLWAHQTSLELASVVKAIPGTFGPPMGVLRDAATAISQVLAAIDPGGDPAKTPDLIDVVAGLHRASVLLGFLPAMGDDLVSSLSRAVELLHDHGRTSSQLAAASEAVKALNESAGRNEPDGVARALEAGAPAAIKAVRDAIEAAAADTGAGAQVSVLLDEGRFEDAALAASVPPRTEATALGDGPDEAGAAPAVPTGTLVLTANEPPGSTLGRRLPAPPSVRQVAAAAASTLG